MKLSVLDQSVSGAGRSQDEALQNTLALAQSCEAWGYNRFWVSEHHSHPSIVGTAPEVLMAAIAARTTRIRLGSAGVMLPHYAPLKVAEQFRVLNALAPGRIDLGVGRAPGSDGKTAQLLNSDRSASDRFPQQVMELKVWVTGQDMPPGHPGAGVHAYPLSSTHPDVWMLGSSDYGAQLAAYLGLPYAFAYFITDGQGVDQALEIYRESYKPSEEHPTPHATVCVWALAAETEQEAWLQFQSRSRWRMDRNVGRIGPLLSPEEAARDYSVGEQMALDQLKVNAFVGSATQVATKFRAFAERLKIDELVVITWAHDPAIQKRSYELLAQEFALTPH
ncbi:MAG: LLM class flavin-dependent oxidoreductase [Burkholderiaceae bacterium]